MKRIKESTCPTCKLKLDATTCVEDVTRSPSPEDVTFCIDCAEFLTFNEDMSLRKVTKADMAKFSDEETKSFQEIREKLIRHIMVNAMNRMIEV